MSIQVLIADWLPVNAVSTLDIALHLLCREPKTDPMSTQGSSATGLRAGWWKGRAIPPRTTLVAALVLAIVCGHPAAWAATPPPEPANAATHTDAIVVRYLVGAPPMSADGRPWGAQCAPKKDRDLLQRGRWIGVGMRTIRLKKPVRVSRAERIAESVAQCPYVEWAEPTLPVQLPLPDRFRGVT